MHWNGELASSYVNVAAILLEMLLKKKKKTPMSYILDLFQEGASEKTGGWVGIPGQWLLWKSSPGLTVIPSRLL